MGNYTTVMVSVGGLEDQPILARLAAPFESDEALGWYLALLPLAHFDPATRTWFGADWGVHPTIELWGGSFKSLDWAALFRHLEGIPWEFPREVQVMIMADQGHKLGLYELDKGKLVPINVEAARQLTSLRPLVLTGGDGPDETIWTVDLYPRTDEEKESLVDSMWTMLGPRSREAMRAELDLLLDGD